MIIQQAAAIGDKYVYLYVYLLHLKLPKNIKIKVNNMKVN